MCLNVTKQRNTGSGLDPILAHAEGVLNVTKQRYTGSGLDPILAQAEGVLWWVGWCVSVWVGWLVGGGV